MRTLLVAAAVVPVALGYSYDYTDAPTAAPTADDRGRWRQRRRLVHGQRLRQLRLWVRALSLPTDVDEAVHLEAVYSTPPPYVQA